MLYWMCTKQLLLACRDVLYLDLALDGAVRSAIETSLSPLKAAVASSEDPQEQACQLIDLTAACLENVCLTLGSNTELLMILKDYQVISVAPHV